MSNQLPYGGREIAAIRANRQKPADMVLVSLIGPLREINPTIIANPERAYDWRFLTGLEVLIVAAMSIPAEQINRVKDSILKINPEYLGVWFSDLKNGSSIAFGSWQPMTKTCRAIGFTERRGLAGVGR